MPDPERPTFFGVDYGDLPFYVLPGLALAGGLAARAPEGAPLPLLTLLCAVAGAILGGTVLLLVRERGVLVRALALGGLLALLLWVSLETGLLGLAAGS